MKRAYWALFVVVLLAIDQYSKFLTETLLPLQEAIPVIPFFSLFRTYNYGVAFSMLSDLNGWPLNVLTMFIIAFIFWLWRELEPGRWLSSLGYALVISGAFGNLLDRVRLGKVVDMILFQIENLNFSFAVFNVADCFITIGAGAIILDEILKWRSGGNNLKDTSKEKQDG